MKRRRIWLAAAALVVSMLAIGGYAGWKWHQEPSFCGTACHKVMATYVETWESGSLLAAEHADKNIECLDCHEPTLSQQIGELQKYLTGDYKTPLSFRQIGDKEFCLDCHGTYADLAKETEGYSGGKFNPHASHSGELDCLLCHRVHEKSQLHCIQCHKAMEVPDGWK